MTKDEAKKILGNQAIHFIRNMRTALEMHPWLNSPEAWQRLEACYVFLNVPAHKRHQIPTPLGEPS